MRLSRIKDKLFRLNYLLGAAIIMGQLLAMPGLTSALFYTTFIVTLLLWLFTAVEGMDRIDALALMIVALALINVLLNGLLCGSSLSFQYLKKYIIFSCTVLFFCVAEKMKIDRETKKFLRVIYLFLGVILLLFYLTRNRQMHLYNDRVTQYLTFRFTNPNLTALFLSCMIMFMVKEASCEKRIWGKVLYLAAAGIEVFFLIQTQSRNAILAISIFLVLMLFLRLRHRAHRKISKWALCFISVFPLLFALLYMRFINSPKLISLFAFFAGEGKNLNSRMKIWRPAFEAFRESPILGAYYQVSKGTGTAQLHNTHVDILATYGILAFILICIYLYHLMCRVQNKNEDQSISLWAFVCTTLLGVGEAALFSGGLGIYLFAGLFLVGETEETGVYNEDRISEQLLQPSPTSLI